MAKKTVTEEVEIEAGAVLSALRSDGWPVSHVDKVEVVDAEGKSLGSFGGLRFTYVKEEIVRQAAKVAE